MPDRDIHVGRMPARTRDPYRLHTQAFGGTQIHQTVLHHDAAPRNEPVLMQQMKESPAVRLGPVFSLLDAEDAIEYISHPQQRQDRTGIMHR